MSKGPRNFFKQYFYMTPFSCICLEALAASCYHIVRCLPSLMQVCRVQRSDPVAQPTGRAMGWHPSNPWETQEIFWCHIARISKC